MVLKASVEESPVKFVAMSLNTKSAFLPSSII
jgi:hypothetical protein